MLEGGPPGPRPTPPSARWRLHKTAGRGRPERTRGSALPLASGPRCSESSRGPMTWRRILPIERDNTGAGPAHLDAPGRVPGQVPAGCIPQLREQRPHAGLGLRIAKRVFEVPILHPHRPKGPHLHAPQGLPVAGNAIARREVVAGVQPGQRQQGDLHHAQGRSHTAILLRYSMR